MLGRFSFTISLSSLFNSSFFITLLLSSDYCGLGHIQFNEYRSECKDYRPNLTKGSNGTFRSKPIGHSIDMDDFETDSEDDELLCRGWPFVF